MIPCLFKYSILHIIFASEDNRRRAQAFADQELAINLKPVMFLVDKLAIVVLRIQSPDDD